MDLPDNIQIGLICRDFGFLADSRGERRILQKEIRDRYARKGNMRYAEMLVEEMLIPSAKRFDRLVVVGDGEGDIRFFSNLEARLSPGREVVGFFVRHPALERLHADFPSAQFFEDWQSLACAVKDRHLADPGRKAIVLIDVDRTVIFPRVQRDVEYNHNRTESVVDYVASFRSDGIRDRFVPQIADVLKTVSAHLREYADNSFNDVCFKNEEIVALGTLISCLGTIHQGWITQRPDPFPLRRLIDISIQGVQLGQWNSWIDRQYLGGNAQVSGNSVWDVTKVIGHLECCQAKLSDTELVIVPKFRDYEAKRLADLLRTPAPVIINQPLLAVLGDILPSTIVFVSDRPSRSLAVPTNDETSQMESSFWKIVIDEVFKQCEKPSAQRQ